MNERQRSLSALPKALIGKASGEFLMHGILPEVIDPDGNLDIARNHLQTGSAILLFNHAQNDFGMWARFVRDNLTTLDKVRAVVAYKYMDPKRGKGSKVFSGLLPAWREAYGIDAIPLVQLKDYERYPNSRLLNGRSLIEARRFLSEDASGHVLGFSVEGTRSATGELGRAEEGSEIILKLNPNSLILPVAADFPIGRKMGLYTYNSIDVHVGKPFFAPEIEEEHAKNPEIEKRDIIASRLAILLPEQSRGYYKTIDKQNTKTT